MRLRRFTAADAEALVAPHGDAAVRRHIEGRPVPRAVVERATLPAVRRVRRAAGGFRPVRGGLRTSWAGSGWRRQPASVSIPADLELGYRPRPDVWGRDLATDGARLLLRRAFTDLGVERVVATTMAVNVASRRVLGKTGPRHVDTFFADWPDPIPGAGDGDVGYAVDRREWRTGRATAGGQAPTSRSTASSAVNAPPNDGLDGAP